MTVSREAELQRVVQFFESLTAESVRKLEAVYTVDVFFKDPFNEVRGLPAVTQIFSHMFTQVDAPRFVVTTRIVQGDDAFLTWDFLFTMRRFSKTEQCIRGASHLRFGENGLVNYHRDYWDAAEELYEKLPVLGSLMRFLKQSARK